MNAGWKVFDINELKKKKPEGRGTFFQEFLSVDSMHCGLYYLEKGSKDMQTPHDEDEMYFVVEGSAKIQVGDTIRDISAGSLLYIEASEEHSFFEIEEDMTLLVIFA